MMQNQEKDCEANREQQALLQQMHKSNYKQQQIKQDENRKLIEMVTQLSQTQVTKNSSQGYGQHKP